MGIESALAEYEHECWCDYNHEHYEDGIGWVSDDEEE